MNSSSVAGRPPAPAYTLAIAFAQFGLWLGLYAPLKILLPLLADSVWASPGLVDTDQALVVEQLPDPMHHARDLGVFNGANTAPMVLAPALAWLCVMHLGGYTTLFAVSASLILASLLPLRGCWC